MTQVTDDGPLGRWTQADLAVEIGLPLQTLKRYLAETGVRELFNPVGHGKRTRFFAPSLPAFRLLGRLHNEGRILPSTALPNLRERLGLEPLVTLASVGGEMPEMPAATAAEPRVEVGAAPGGGGGGASPEVLRLSSRTRAALEEAVQEALATESARGSSNGNAGEPAEPAGALLLTRAEVARRLRCEPAAVPRRVRSAPGRRGVYLASDVDAYLARLAEAAAQRRPPGNSSRSGVTSVTPVSTTGP